MRLTLPWPPSVNTYWRHPNKGPLASRHLISEKGRDYRAFVLRAVKWQAYDLPKGRLEVSILANPPDARKRDLDNILKSLLDSLAHAGLIEDDGFIDKLSIERGEINRGGGSVTVEVMGL